MSENMLQKPSRRSILVLDANAFINCSKIHELGAKYRLVTTSDVIAQLKDEKTKKYLQTIPFQIEEKDFEPESLVFVKQFSKKTGDIGSLSDVDMQLLALAHTLYVKEGLKEKLRKQPPPIKQTQKQVDIFDTNHANQEEQTAVDQPQQIRQSSDKEQESQNSENEQYQDQGEWITVPKDKKKQQQSQGSDLDEDQGWVTPQNYQLKMAEVHTQFLGPQNGKNVDNSENSKQGQQRSSNNEEDDEKLFEIILISADFSIQNVATQMGIKLMALDGRVIRTIRRFIWECYLCWKQYTITTNKVKICSNCGYNSLSKISYSMDVDGNVVLHRKKGWKPNLKVQQWKERKYEQEQKKKKHQHSRRSKKASIFETY